MGWTAVSQKVGNAVVLATTTKVGLAPTSKLKGITTPVAAENAPTKVLAVGDALDFIGTFAVTTPATPYGTLVAKKAYSSIYVLVTGQEPAYATTADETLEAKYGAGAVPTFGTPMWPGPTKTPALNGAHGILRCANEPGDTIRVQLFGSFSRDFSVYVFGFTNSLAAVRNDGRALSMGTQSATFTGTLTSGGTLVAAPTSPLRLMLQSVGLVVNAPAENPFIYAKLNGVTLRLVQIRTKGSFTLPIPPQGLVLDKATPIKYGATGTTSGTFSAVYDIVY